MRITLEVGEKHFQICVLSFKKHYFLLLKKTLLSLKYYGSLNNIGLNYTGPLIRNFFTKYIV